MRRFVKKQLLALMKMVSQAYGSLENQWTGTNTDVILQILEDCQTCSIQAGTVIERSEGEGTKTVHMLEDHCEMIYHASQLVADRPSFKNLVRILTEQASDIAGSIKQDIREEKLEAVFFPYKASMWDSLESIWETASKDSDFNTYVVPIPYFDKNPDGSLGQMHYEGDLFPEYVPITDWQSYKISDRYPDIIFIHNPYDNSNYVTCVHSEYFAKNLVNYTDMLVYVPYFVIYGDVPKHFCVCPGTLYSHRVFVQSNQVRATYIKEFRQFEKENHCRGGFGNAKLKFLSLGSPKFDRVLTAKKDNLKLPAEWNFRLQRESNFPKKVIFYNTTISALLQYSERMITKIASVMRFFKENREDMVLLWRPHPLSLSTLTAMRPQLVYGYLALIEEFKGEGWGIYDDTPDLYRAIAMSDAYYGDWSSVVALYKLTGKPIMIQNVENT